VNPVLLGVPPYAHLPVFIPADVTAPFELITVLRAEGEDYNPSSAYARSFSRSILHFDSCTFTDLMIIGAAVQDALGGALSLLRCQLSISSCLFTNCTSFMGGAVGGTDTVASISQTHFAGCCAYFMGGAAGFKCLPPQNEQTTEFIVFVQCTFSQCISREIAGGLAFLDYSDVAVDRCDFVGCAAGLAGGALYSSNSDLLLFSTVFNGNSAGGARSGKFAGLVDTDRGPHGSERAHGGAISAIVQSEGGSNFLGTELCCFFRNSLLLPSGALGDSRCEGFDVYIRGAVYQSSDDRFLNYRAVSVFSFPGSSAVFYHSLFAVFPNDGHACFATDGFAEAVDDFSGPAALVSYSPEYGSVTANTNGFTDEGETSQTEEPPWRTPPPPARPTPAPSFTREVWTPPGYHPADPPSPTRTFGATAGFAGTEAFAAAAQFTRGESSAAATLDVELETWSFSVETMSVTLTVSLSIEISLDASGSQVVIIHTTAVLTDLLLYTVVRSSVFAPVQQSSPRDRDGGLPPAALIGLVTGCAAILALLAGGSVYIIRSRMREGSDSGRDSVIRIQRTEGTETGFDYAVQGMSTKAVESLADLSSVTDDSPAMVIIEDVELWV
jgi:hypothetical protein